LDYQVPISLIEIFGSCPSDNTRIIDQNINGPKVILDALNRRFNLLYVRNIERRTYRVDSGCCELFGALPEFVQISAINYQGGSSSAKSFGNSIANTLRPSR